MEQFVLNNPLRRSGGAANNRAGAGAVATMAEFVCCQLQRKIDAALRVLSHDEYFGAYGLYERPFIYTKK